MTPLCGCSNVLTSQAVGGGCGTRKAGCHVSERAELYENLAVERSMTKELQVDTRSGGPAEFHEGGTADAGDPCLQWEEGR